MPKYNCIGDIFSKIMARLLYEIVRAISLDQFCILTAASLNQSAQFTLGLILFTPPGSSIPLPPCIMSSFNV
jgi:hypothetical protein